MNKKLWKKVQMGLVSLSTVALLAACGSDDLEDPDIEGPDEDDPAVEYPADDPEDAEENELEDEEPVEDETEDEDSE